MKHVRDLYFQDIDVAKQIHSSMNLTMAIAITLIGQALILSGLVLEAKQIHSSMNYFSCK